MNKKWEVIILDKNAPRGRRVEIIELGPASNRHDVIEQIRRQGSRGEILRIREIIENPGHGRPDRVRFVRNDSWGRRVFADDSGNRYVEVDGLLHTMTTEGEPLHPIEMDKKTIMGWLENIADNYNNDRDTNIQSQIVDMANELGMEYHLIDERWQRFSAGEKTSAEILYRELIPDRYKIEILKSNPGQDNIQPSIFERPDSKFRQNPSGVGKFDYKTVDIRTEKGMKEAEKLQAEGWKQISVSGDRIQFERPKNIKQNPLQRVYVERSGGEYQVWTNTDGRTVYIHSGQDFDAIKAWAKRKGYELIVVNPEQPLSSGSQADSYRSNPEQKIDYSKKENEHLIPYAEKTVIYINNRKEAVPTWKNFENYQKGWGEVHVGEYMMKARHPDRHAVLHELLTKYYPGFNQQASTFSDLSYHSALTRGKTDQIDTYGTHDYTLNYSSYDLVNTYKLRTPVRTNTKKSFGQIIHKFNTHVWHYIVLDWIPGDKIKLQVVYNKHYPDPDREEQIYASKIYDLSEKDAAIKEFKKVVADFRKTRKKKAVIKRNPGSGHSDKRVQKEKMITCTHCGTEFAVTLKTDNLKKKYLKNCPKCQGLIEIRF